MVDVERERLVMRLFEEVVDLDPQDQAEALRQKTLDDPHLRERVEELLQTNSTMRIRTGGAIDVIDEPDPPERIGQYKIGELIGSGGMGSVFAGSRDRGDFRHEVAIKLIKPGALSERLIERFNYERQILAQFSHPHIARLFDGGETDEGQPYIVMERIEGVSLSDWLRAGDRTENQRLRLFLQICNAVAHAHRNLIIHRDLTPSNVLVDGDGQAKLIDFGIARPDGEDLPQGAQQGAQEGAMPLARMTLTPGYAAPERLRGERATTLSDVYSAGRLLAELFPRPRPTDLQAIIDKARAEEPEDRYQSIDDLADDIRRVLDTRPVSAMPLTARYRFAKFVRRNPSSMALSAALALALVAGLGAAAYSWSEAVAARNEAEQRFEQVRDLAGAMMFDVYDEIARVPGSEAARERMAAEALAYLDSLAADEDAPLDVRLEAARGYLRLGEITGSFSAQSLGRLAEGRDIAAVGLALLHELHATHPGNAAVRQELAAALTRRSREALYATGDGDEAAALAEEAIALFGPAMRDPADVGHLAEAHSQLGEARIWGNDIDGAIASYATAIALLEALPDEVREQDIHMNALAGAYEMQGRAYADTGEDFEIANELVGRAVAIYRAAYQRDPTPALRGQLSVSLFYLLKVARMLEDDAAAEEYAAEGMALMRQAQADSPDDATSRALFAAFALQRAALFANDGQRTEALALVDEALAASEATLAGAGGVVGADMRHAVRLHEAAEVQEVAGARARSCTNLRRAVTIFDEFAETQPIPETNMLANYRPMLAALERC